jgi:hypothetical protein
VDYQEPGQDVTTPNDAETNETNDISSIGALSASDKFRIRHVIRDYALESSSPLPVGTISSIKVRPIMKQANGVMVFTSIDGEAAGQSHWKLIARINIRSPIHCASGVLVKLSRSRTPMALSI